MKPVEVLNDIRAQPDERLTRDCADPVLLPEGKLQVGPGERFWARDRAALIDCKQTKSKLRDFYKDRDAKLGGLTH